MQRRRTCSECGKPLGNTLGRCHECGGETYRAGGQMVDDWGRYWKIEMGIPWPKIVEVHGPPGNDEHEGHYVRMPPGKHER